jgi:hypothetical protein
LAFQDAQDAQGTQGTPLDISCVRTCGKASELEIWGWESDGESLMGTICSKISWEMMDWYIYIYLFIYWYIYFLMYLCIYSFGGRNCHKNHLIPRYVWRSWYLGKICLWRSIFWWICLGIVIIYPPEYYN